MAIDLVTFGEAMVRLSSRDFQRLELAHALDVHVGGSELNAAVAAAQMGLKTSFVTRLTQNAMGRSVARCASVNNVDTSGVVWTDKDRVGVYYLEYGASPRASSVLYDRAYSAMSKIHPGMVDWPSILDGTKLFYTSGITPALSSGASEATLEAVQAAREAGVTVCVDLNYRAGLWSKKEAREVMTDIATKTDILFATEEDTKRVFGIEEKTYEDVARRLAETFDLRIVAITLRENLTVWRNHWTAIAYETETDTVHRAPMFDIEIVDRVGSGDSFVGGFLYGYLAEGAAHGVEFGVGLSAIKQTHPGDVVCATSDEVKRVLRGNGLRIVR